MQYCIEGFEEIFDKVIGRKELTSEEVRDIYWELPEIHEEEGEHLRWYYMAYKVFEVYDKYYQIYVMRGLTECQDSEYEPQIAIEIEPREKTITVWEAVD